MRKISLQSWIVVFLLFFIGQKAIAQDVLSNDSEITPGDSIGVDIIMSDSIIVPTDSAKRSSLDAPVHLTAKDSMVMVMEGGSILHLYGKSSAKYRDDTLEAEYIRMDADSSLLYAKFGLDSIGAKFGYPVFKSNDQQTEMEELQYNIKTKKMFTRNVITQQGEGFITAGVAKKMPDDSFYMQDGKYTTCDNHEHPHFYFNLTKAKFRPGKNTITGPAYLVVEDVPLPIAIPFGFFPASKSYSSGILMPSYGDEMARGFSLRDGGYYFAFNDYVDLALTGEIYTKGSWGLSALSSYTKRYKFSGNFDASYLVTITGDKDTKNYPNSDYSQSRDIKVNWNHRQDPKSNPYGTFTAGVQFSTSSFSRNDFRSITSSQMTENTKASSLGYSYRSPTLPLSINTTMSINQRSKDSTLTVSLPDMTISLSSIYPFKRKEQIGSERWYEKIYLSYTGTIRNSINDVKENQFFKKNIFKDWRNGIKHSIPVSASFNILKYITISTSLNYNENWYSNRINYGYDNRRGSIVPIDTVYGFHRTYDYNGSISLNTKLYGMYKPWALFGKWTKGVQIRHVLTPSVSFSGAPDFSNPKLGMYKDIIYIDNSYRKQVERYSLYQSQLFGGPSSGRTGAVSFGIDNNLEMKTPIAGTDSTRKTTLIDNLGLRMSYNFLADSLNWSNLSATLRLKILKSTLSLSGNFDTYIYDENGRSINTPRWKVGKGIGRFMGTSTGYSYTLSNETFKKLLKKGDSNSAKTGEDTSPPDQEGNTDEEGTPTTRTSLFQSEKKEGDFDSDGYLILAVPWSLTFNYSINVAYDRQHFNKDKREYPYRTSQTLGFNGNISPTKSWKISFTGSYDFDNRRIASMFCSVSRQMHCWSMSASIVPVGPYQNYSFTIAVNSSLLQDFKYQQSSTSRDALNWGY
ncbi:MAG: LPS-assembly protein LptD [Candidatus Azobacteroides sp.]|nr:LPS-assembly protein LptD [Candidatus Azobacteroides sp.]